MINSIIKFPKGNANFKEIREQGFLYIDKTKYIENIENENLKSIIILRPRRFGKSLFINMLACYYDIKETDHFDMLFKNTYIHEHPTKNRNAYYVLKFNFSGLTGKHGKELETEFSMKVLDSLRKFISYYNIDIMLLENNSAARILSRFFVDVEPYLKDRKIYFLIDEYDHFANELLSFAYQEFTSVTNSDGYVRAFYEELKYATETVVARIFMTGVSPITLDSLTSGFNISTNLSLDSRFNEMLGFTIEEMKYLISMVSSIKDADTVLADMKQYYDGYMFSADGKHRIFNPNMALYYLDYWQNFGKQPNEIVDKNILSDYQKLENLLYLPFESNEDIQIQNILDGHHPEVNLTEMFTIQTGLTTDDFYSLLFYLGYLTIDEADAFGMTLRIPNMIMQKVFIKYFRHMLEKQLDFKSDTSLWKKAVVTFLNSDYPDLFVGEIEKILHRYPDRLFQNFHERNIQQIADVIVESVVGVDVDLEWLNDNGYGDFMMIPSNAIYPNKLIEFKYLKNSYSQEQLERAVQDAENQLRRYHSTRQMHRQKCDMYVMAFSKNKCIYVKRYEE